MQKTIKLLLAILIISILSVKTRAQQSQLNVSQQFRLAERVVRIAEPGELVDSVSVWGDIGSSGLYLVPKGTSLAKLLSYSLGPRTLRDNQTQIDWSKMRVEIYIHEHDTEKSSDKVDSFKYRFEENFPPGMWSYLVTNNQTVTVLVKRKPSFRDYLTIFATTISAVASTVILLERLAGK